MTERERKEGQNKWVWLETAISRYCSGKHGKNHTPVIIDQKIVFACSAKMNDALNEIPLFGWASITLPICPSLPTARARTHPNQSAQSLPMAAPTFHQRPTSECQSETASARTNRRAAPAAEEE
jgi:hypothetical protein